MQECAFVGRDSQAHQGNRDEGRVGVLVEEDTRLVRDLNGGDDEMPRLVAKLPEVLAEGSMLVALPTIEMSPPLESADSPR